MLLLERGDGGGASGQLLIKMAGGVLSVQSSGHQPDTHNSSLVSTRTAVAAAMPAVHGAGERLALFAGGALVLALVQLLQARRKGDGPANDDHGTRGRHKPHLRTFLEKFLGATDRTSSIEVCVRVGQHPLVISRREPACPVLVSSPTRTCQERARTAAIGVVG